jgi:hypothetical protein
MEAECKNTRGRLPEIPGRKKGGLGCLTLALTYPLQGGASTSHYSKTASQILAKVWQKIVSSRVKK